jgi:signal transduction histidine kinase
MLPTIRRTGSPLSIAAYITWAAVSYAVWQHAAALAAVAGFAARDLATGSLLIFLGAIVLLNRLANTPSSSHSRRRAFLVVGLSVQVIATFALLYLGALSTSPVLLIIVAAEAMIWLDARAGWILLICLNAAFYVLLVILKVDNPVFLVALYGGFQLFAALTAGSMKQAQRAAETLRLTNAELLATRALLAESARDGERLRMSRELHDLAGHKLTALSLNLEVLRTGADAPPKSELDLAWELSQEVLSDIRGVVSNLRAHDGIDLEQALARLTTVFPRPKVSLRLEKGLRIQGTDGAEALLRCAQEGLANSARHGGAANAYVSLTEDSNHVSLVVEDDGEFLGSFNAGNGLKGLEERIESLRGSLVIDRGPRGGCRLVARIPKHRQP